LLELAVVVFLFLSCAAGVLIGGIPFGYLTGHFVLKDDIRSYGSGNIGATNVGRVLGWNWGAFVLLLDALKGLIPTLGAAYYAGKMVIIPDGWVNHAAVAAGLSSIMGHMYPIYLRLRGGKGVATALGVVIVLAPRALGVALIVFVVVLGFSRRIALASMLAAVTFGAAWMLIAGDEAWTMATSSLTAFAIIVPLLIIWRHRSNIERLLSGTEPEFTETGHDASPGSNGSVGTDDA